MKKEVPLVDHQPPDSLSDGVVSSGDAVSSNKVSAATLFQLHARFVATFARRLGVPAADLDDIVQETFMIVHRHGGFMPGQAKPTTWLAAIALRVWSSTRRNRRRRPQVPVTEMTGTPVDTWPRLEARDALNHVEQALSNLNEESRAVFVLFELQGESCEDIARGLSIPLGTVYSRLHKARKKFQDAHARLITAPELPSLPNPRHLSTETSHD